MWLMALLGVLSVVLVVRPLRAIYLRNAVFTVPATLGAAVGYFIAIMVLPLTPSELAWATPVNMLIWGIGMGEELGRWLRRLPR